MRQIVGHGFGCKNSIRNEKFYKYKKIQFFSKKLKKKTIFKIFHFWSVLYNQNHNQQFVSCLNFMIIYEKSMWYA